MTTFTRKALEFTFQLGKGSFGESGFNTLTVTDVRAVARVTNAGGQMSPQLDLMIYGLTLSQMRQLSTLGQVMNSQRRNIITVKAGDRGSTLNQVYIGDIRDALFEGTSAPDTAFHVISVTAAYAAVQPTKAISYPGGKDPVQMLQQIADKMGVKFENSGVTGVILTDHNVPRSLREQALDVIRSAGIEWNGIENGVLAVWPKGGFRRGPVPIISPTSGLVGYPTFSENGIKFRCYYNPVLKQGGNVQMQGSILEEANGTWNIIKLDHELASEMPHGPWFCDVDTVRPGFSKVA